MAEHYVRPPLVAREPGSGRAAAARFWLVFAVFIAAIIVAIFFLYRLVTASTGEGSPGITNPQGLPAVHQLR